MASDSIISRLNSFYTNSTGDSREHPDYLTRDIGGHFRKNQPYISGYFQIIVGLPEKLFTNGAKEASQWLHSTCEGFTPHSQTLNKVDVQGQGQVGSSYVASVTTTREFTLTFREYQNMPIMNIIRRWTSIMDPYVGASPLQGNEFIPMNYKGWIAVAQTKPTGARPETLKIDDIEECYIYQGVFPTNIPVDTASATDITGNDTVQLSSTMSFDGTPLTSSDPGVTEKVVNLLADMQMIGNDDSTYDRYLNTGTEVQQWGSHGDSQDTNLKP